MRSLLVAALLFSTAALAESPVETQGVLIAVLGYTHNNCPEFTPNREKFKVLFEQTGVTSGSEMPVASVVKAAEWSTDLEQLDSSAVCQLLWEQFGTTGTNVPDLLRLR